MVTTKVALDSNVYHCREVFSSDTFKGAVAHGDYFFSNKFEFVSLRTLT